MEQCVFVHKLLMCTP